MLPLKRIMLEVGSSIQFRKKNEEARAAHWWKLGLENWLRWAGHPKFLNEFPAFDNRIAQNSKLETHLGNLVKTQPKPVMPKPTTAAPCMNLKSKLNLGMIVFGEVGPKE
jgi:hypothetical protein